MNPTLNTLGCGSAADAPPPAIKKATHRIKTPLNSFFISGPPFLSGLV
jgi:hypothetical protein